mmetsp:Transcript_18826/g.45244  ORF Transcript_18826/g.45244 Transcript_18826/m.45244 type:complete len:197 (-) Transcript_18826:142-732(-)
MLCSLTSEEIGYSTTKCATGSTDVYLAMVADVVLDRDCRSHRNLRILGCFRSVSESNAAATRSCVSMQAAHLSKFPNTVPSLKFSQQSELMFVEQEFTDLNGNLQFLQHFWVQRLNLSVPSSSIQKLFVVCRGLVQDEDEGMVDVDEDVEDETSDEEIVAVALTSEEANRLTDTCCETSDRDEGTWLVWIKCIIVN